MRYYRKQNVFDAALDRIRYIFDEFPEVCVSISGGKDSTVVLNLALIVAEEKNRLPLKVMFVDQEAEWQSVIDHVREVYADTRIEQRWLQVPIKLFNATSTLEPWLMCWEEGKQWIRNKEPDSIHENIYGTDRFIEMFARYLTVEYGKTKACNLSGVRCEESPARLVGLTTMPTYKWITWGKKNANGKFTFHPIYDWHWQDVWKAIHDNKWAYCKIYDYMYQYGIPIRNMRVSNVHHETAIQTLYYLQEIEAETWTRVQARLSGVNTAKTLGHEFDVIKTLPWMFDNWTEYRDYLLEHLIQEESSKVQFRKMFATLDKLFVDGRLNPKTVPKYDHLARTQIRAILLNDFHLTTLDNFRGSRTLKRKKNEAPSIDNSVG